MKHIYSSIFLLLLATCPLTIHANNETSYLPEIEFRNRTINRQNREVTLTMVIDLSKLKLHTQHTVALTPVLVSKDDNREVAFPPVVIDGKTRNKVYLRAQHIKSITLPPIHDSSAQAIIRRNNGKEQSYDYRAAISYERWMLGGRIEVREQVSGCANCNKGQGEQSLPESEAALAAFIPNYNINKVAPAPEPVKRRAEVRVARLQFRQDSYKIQPEFKNNRYELDSVFHSIALVKENKDLTVTGIYVTGYASPEGSVAYNERLSKNRAESFTHYIQQHTTDIPSSLWHVSWKGEDWEGLRREVEKHSQLLKKDEILRIIDECDGNQDDCEKKIKALFPPEIYQRLLNEMYGPLRRNEYRIEYNVRNFNIEEAKQQIKHSPELLSIAEMYAVADSYGEGTEEYRETILTAARTYPDKATAVVNAARVELERGNVSSAIRLLENTSATETPEIQNALGVAYATDGQYDKARKWLQRAKAAGNAEAQNNLQQVAGVMNDL